MTDATAERLLERLGRLIDGMGEDRADRRDNAREMRETFGQLRTALGEANTTDAQRHGELLAAIAEQGKQNRHDVRDALTAEENRAWLAARARVSTEAHAAGGETKPTPLVDDRLVSFARKIWPLLLAGGTFAAGWIARHVSFHP